MITDKGDYLEYYGGAVKSCPKEDWEQVVCFDWAKYNYPQYVFWHSVNEGKKHIHTALRDEQAGLLKGVSDFVILIGLSDGPYPFGAIELKRQGKTQASPVSKEQRDFLKRVRGRGGFAAVAYGNEQFKLAWLDMLGVEHE